MEITTETNVPVPVSTRKGNSTFTPVYEKIGIMAAGECITFKPEIKAGLKNPLSNAVYNCRKFARTMVGKTFVVKDMGDGSVKVWNITVLPVKPVEEKQELVKEGDAPAE